MVLSASVSSYEIRARGGVAPNSKFHNKLTSSFLAKVPLVASYQKVLAPR